ncbi:MAG: glycoside hydrolase family 31 protein [Anaerolineae bacterium]|nr:glycoside hydrolase family 31 protein [Anaerolineae bacterium]
MKLNIFQWISRIKALLIMITPRSAIGALRYTFIKPLTETNWRSAPRWWQQDMQLKQLTKGILPRLTAQLTTWEPAGCIKAIVLTERGGRFWTENGFLSVAFLTSDMLQIRYTHTALDEPCASYAVIRSLEDWPAPEIQHLTLDNAFLFKNSDLVVAVSLDTAQVIIADSQGQLLRTDIDMARAADGTIRHRTVLGEQTRIFGLGERAQGLNQRTHKHILWNTDPKGYQGGDDPLYINIPLYISVQALERGVVRTSLVFYDNPHRATFDLGATTPAIADHQFTAGELCYYFISGPPPHLLEQYTALTGRHNLPPMWLLGYHQSRWSYKSSERVLKLTDDFAKYEVPCDSIYLDIDYMDAYKVFTINRQRFPDIPALAVRLKEQGIHLVSILDPGVKREKGYSLYDQGAASGYFVTSPDGHIFHAPVWAGPSAFPDFTSSAVRSWWSKHCQTMMDMGISGLWTDMNEPATFLAVGDPTLPGNVRHNADGQNLRHTDVHNLYGMLMARATQEGLVARDKQTRPVVITRAGSAGVQRYATSWTGDNASSWASLKLTIPMVINMGLSGIGFTGSDVGGFAGEAGGELFTRWIQMAAFMPYFRSHTAKGTPDQEPWSYGEPYLSIIRRFIELRYELLPYLYTAVWQMHTCGTPVVRPLWWEAAEQAKLLSYEDAFLCGDNLAVAPIMQPGVDRRDLILPPGHWYDYWTNILSTGGHAFQPFAPLETLPLFVHEGTVLPLGEIGPSTSQRSQKFLRLNIYPLVNDGLRECMLYEDAGEGFGYLEGEFRLSTLLMHKQNDTLTLTWTGEGDYHPPYEHIALTFNGLQRIPKSIHADGTAYPIVQADPVRHVVLAGCPIFKELVINL